jgi:hypothetical protein
MLASASQYRSPGLSSDVVQRKAWTMLIKEADDQSIAIAELERLATGTGPEAKRAKTELRNRKAGLKGEAESSYLIDFDYGNSPNWAVIHDLRLEHGGRTAQIDHLLINRWMEFFVLETKQFHAGVKITDDGEFLRWNNFDKHYEGMPSPLQQNERHIAVLSDVVSRIEFPSRFGMRIAPTFNSLVLVAPSVRIDRPKKFDASRVIKADQLKPKIWRDLDMDNAVTVLFKAAARMVSGETVEFVAKQLAALHTRAPQSVPTMSAEATGVPMEIATQQTAVTTSPKTRIEPTFGAVTKQAPSPVNIDATAPRSAPTARPPQCKSCHAGTGSILHGKFGYYFKCSACGSNTSMRFTCQPGHNPRVRKDGNGFYRECAECGTSERFHQNP